MFAVAFAPEPASVALIGRVLLPGIVAVRRQK